MTESLEKIAASQAAIKARTDQLVNLPTTQTGMSLPNTNNTGRVPQQTDNGEQTSTIHPQPYTFLRTPLQAGVNTVLDLTTEAGTKYFKRATKSLYSENTNKFDVESNNFTSFIELLHGRVKDLGMLEDESNLMIPINRGSLIKIDSI